MELARLAGTGVPSVSLPLCQHSCLGVVEGLMDSDKADLVQQAQPDYPIFV